MAREGDIVDVPGGQVDAAVGRQLGGVKGDPGAVATRYGDDLGNRPHLTGDVGGAGDDDEAVLRGHRAERGVQGPYAVRHGRGDTEGDGPVGSPWQQRRMMLRRESDDGGVLGERMGQQIPGVCGVAGEDDVIVVADPDEPPDLLARRVVPPRGHPAGVSVAAMHRSVAGHHTLHRGHDAAQGGSRRRVIEVCVVDPAVGHGHL